MKKVTAPLLLVSLFTLLSGTAACVSTVNKLPRIDGRETVAVVNGEPITREEYQQEISSLHRKMLEKEAGETQDDEGHPDRMQPGKIDHAQLLQRMVNVRLIVQEAKRMGLNDLPDTQRAMKKYSEGALRTLLMKEVTKDVQPDADQVEQLYAKAVREWKFDSLMFPKEADAKQMADAVRKGGDFAALADKAVSGKKAKRSADEGYLSGDKVLPQLYDALLTMGTGSVSQAIAVPGGYALVQLKDARRRESPEKRDAAAAEVRRQRMLEVSREFLETLKKKYVVIDTDLLDSIDMGTSIDAFDALLKDERVIARIGDKERITVADLTNAVKQKFFHGVEKALKSEKIDEKKYGVLDRLVEKDMLLLEAAARGIDKTEEYAVLTHTYENSVLFGLFVQKAVLPDIKVMESDVRAYYDGHSSEYTSPEMMKLDSVVFEKRSDAEEAMRKLRAGDQIAWIKENSAGQVAKDADGLLQMNGNVVATSVMDEGLRAALSGAGDGSFVLYESPEGYFYAIAVMAVYPPKTADYLEVREQIARKLYSQRVQAGLDDWIEKLKKAADIHVYLTF